MTRIWLSATAAIALSTAALYASAQEAETPAPVAAIDLKCSDMAGLEPAHAAALVYYVAGYKDAQAAAGGTAAVTDNGMVGGLTLSAAAVIAACAAAADTLVADIIIQQGGSSGAAATPAPAEETAPSEGATEPPVEGAEGTTEAPAEGTEAPAGETTPSQ